MAASSLLLLLSALAADPDYVYQRAGDSFDFATWTGTGVPATVGAKAGATMETGSL